MSRPQFRVRVKVSPLGHEHEVCVPVDRGVHPDLRCGADEDAGYSTGTGGGCRLPVDLLARVERQLREDYQESRRRGYVLIAA